MLKVSLLNKKQQFTLGWVILIFILCVLSPSNINYIHPFKYFDKVIHFLLFMILSLFLTDVFKNQRKVEILNLVPFSVASFLAISYGGFIEIIQNLYLPNRTADWLDFIANIAGVLFSYILLACISFRKKNYV